MGATPQEALGGLLGQLSPDRAAKLAEALEAERQAGGGTLPYGLILDSIRPALQRGKRAMQRVMTPQRLLCIPFEDMLGPGGATKHRGRIRRASLMPVFDWLQKDLMPGEYDRLMEQAATALLSGEPRRIHAAAMSLHGVCGMVLATGLRNAMPGTSRYAAIARRLGGTEILEDARDMAMVLEIADDIRAMQKALPRPIAEMNEDCIAVVRATYDIINAHLPEHARYVIFVAMGRLVRPWEVLRLIGKLTNQDTDALIAQSDLADCGALLFADLDQSVAFFKALDVAKPDSSEIVHHLTYFSNLSQGITLALGITREGDWGAHIAEARSNVSQVMAKVLDTVDRDIRNSVPTLKDKGLGASECDFERAPDGGLWLDAADKAGFLAQLRYLAEGAAFAKPYASITTDLVGVLQKYMHSAMDVVKARVATDGTLDANHPASRHAAFALELCQALIPAEEARVLAKKLTLAHRGKEE